MPRSPRSVRTRRRHASARQRLTPAFASTLALVLPGCGLGAGDPPQDVSLRVTDGFGSRVLVDRPRPKLGGEDTVLGLLQRNTEIETRYGGTYVTSIARTAAEAGGSRTLDWIYYVDGVVAPRGASAWRLRDGDRVWWDRQDTGATADGTPAVVGSYPAPLVGGVDGRSTTVSLVCAEPRRAACGLVRERLVAAGATLATRADEALPRTERRSPVRVVVGTVEEAVRLGDLEGEALAGGPGRSGVFLRPGGGAAGGAELLDARGRPAGPLGAGEGVVAATRLGVRAPVWFVLGADRQGVRRAAKALDERSLAGRIAAHVTPAGTGSLPARGSRDERRR